MHIIAYQNSTFGRSVQLEKIFDSRPEFKKGDLVSVKTSPANEHFCIVDFKHRDSDEPLAILKALFNDTYIIEKPISELKSLLTRGIL
jgi:hypothetical protein